MSQQSSAMPALFPNETTTAVTRATMTSQYPYLSVPSCTSHRSRRERLRESRLSKKRLRIARQMRTRPQQMHYDVEDNFSNDDDHDVIVHADCDVDEVDGGDVMDSSNNTVHVLDRMTSSKAASFAWPEVMDESDIVRIFPNTDPGNSPTTFKDLNMKTNQTSSNNGSQEENGIVRIFTSDNDDDDDDDDSDHDDNYNDNDNDNDNTDVVDHIMSSTSSLSSSSSTTTTTTTTPYSARLAPPQPTNSSHKSPRKSPSTTSAFRTSPSKRLPNLVQHHGPNNCNTNININNNHNMNNNNNNNIQSTPYHTTSTTTTILPQDFDKSRNFNVGGQCLDLEGMIPSSRKFHYPTSRYSEYYKDSTRRKFIPGKSANPDLFDPELYSVQQPTQKFLEQYRLLQGQSQGQGQGQACSTRNCQTIPLENNTYNNNNNKNSNNNNNNNSVPNCSIPNMVICSSIPPTYTNTLVETTPTKKLPSKFGKIRRSPVLLPTPPQTPDDRDGEDDDDVFSYDVNGRSCVTNIDNYISSNDPSTIFRRNSDSSNRTTTNDATDRTGGSGRRLSNRSSPFPFSPTHKMARMKVGDRQQTRKRLSFEDIDSNTAHASSSPLNDVDSLEQNVWTDHHSHPMMINSDITRPSEINNPYNSNASPTHKMNNNNNNNNNTPIRRKSISPFNSPPSHSSSSNQHNIHPASRPTNSSHFSSFDSQHFDVERNNNNSLVRPTTVSVHQQVFCSGRPVSSQSPPSPHHNRSQQRQLVSSALLQHCQPPSITMSHSSDQSYPFNHDDVTETHDHHIEIPSDNNNIRHIRQSPISSRQFPPFPLERKPRMRFHSEGFSDVNDDVEYPAGIARSINSNEDGCFQTRPRVQTIPSYGKRRRFDCNDEDRVDATGLETYLLSAVPTTPKKKTSPALSVDAFTTTTTIKNSSNHNIINQINTNNHNNIFVPTSPNNSTTPQNPRLPQPQTTTTQALHNNNIIINNNNNKNSSNPNPQQQQQQQQQQQHQQTTTLSTPRTNCLCAHFLRSFLNFVSDAYGNVRASPGGGRQDMANINDAIHKYMSMYYEINTNCEHHGTTTTNTGGKSCSNPTNTTTATTASSSSNEDEQTAWAPWGAIMTSSSAAAAAVESFTLPIPSPSHSDKSPSKH